MTEEQAIRELKAQVDNTDFESAHWKADDILCEFLESEGYDDLVDVYRKVGKWYA